MAFTYGMDVSNWQKLVDWNRVAQQGFTFALIKCTQATGKDPSFKNHWAAAKSAGLLRGAYHFFTQDTSPQKQVQAFLQALGDDPGELPAIVDVERERFWDESAKKMVVVSIKHPAKFADNLQVWVQDVGSQLGRRPIIYTGSGVWDDVMRINGAFPAWASEYELWVANYKTLPYKPKTKLTTENLAMAVGDIALGQLKPRLPKSWAQWRFWQFSGDTYYLDGVQTLDQDNKTVKSYVDFDVFNGTQDQLRAWARVDSVNYVDITKYTNQKVLAAFLMAFGNGGGHVLEGTGLMAQLDASPTELYTGPAIQDIPNLTFEQELALNSALMRQISNQKVINAFRDAFGMEVYWEVVKRAGLEYLKDKRQDIYIGPPVDLLPLTQAERTALKVFLPIS